MLSLEYLHHFCLRKHCPKKPPSSLFLCFYGILHILYHAIICVHLSRLFPPQSRFLGRKKSVSSLYPQCLTLLWYLVQPGVQSASWAEEATQLTSLSAQNLPFSKDCPAHHILLECSVGQIIHLLHSKGSCNIVQRNWRLTAPKVAWLIQRWAQGWDPGVVLLNLSGSSPSFGSCPHCLQEHKPSIWLF